MDLGKYTGTVPNGDHPAKIADVTAEENQKKDGWNLVFHANIPSLELVNRQYRRSLKSGALGILRDDLDAAEVLREGDSYSDDPNTLAAQIKEDLGDRMVVLTYKDGKNGYQDIRITGLFLDGE